MRYLESKFGNHSAANGQVRRNHEVNCSSFFGPILFFKMLQYSVPQFKA